MCTICASSVSAPTRSARMTSDPVPLTVAPMTRSGCSFFHRHRLAGHHRFVHGAGAFEDHAVHRHLLAGPDAQAIAGLHPIERHVFLGAVLAHAARGLRGEAEQRPDRRARLTARAQLEDLPEQHERDDHRRGLEVDGDVARLIAEGRGKQAREQRRDHAVGIGDAHAKADQREHVQAAVDERLPAAHEERPCAPEHDRRRQHEPKPAHIAGEGAPDRAAGPEGTHSSRRRRPESSAPCSPRTGASCRRAPRSRARPRPESSARASCRKSDSSRARRARSGDASGTSTSSRPALGAPAMAAPHEGTRGKEPKRTVPLETFEKKGQKGATIFAPLWEKRGIPNFAFF